LEAEEESFSGVSLPPLSGFSAAFGLGLGVYGFAGDAPPDQTMIFGVIEVDR
jgi:hypothetical protein